MTNRGIDDDFGVFYDGQYSVPQTEDHNGSHTDGQHGQVGAYTSSMPGGNYAYPPHNPMLAYGPTANTSISMGLGSGGAFPYDLPTYASPIVSLGHGLDNLTSLQPHPSRPENVSTYSASQPQEPTPAMHWAQPHATQDISFSTQNALPQLPPTSCPVEPSASQASQTGKPQHAQRLPQASMSGPPPHRFIQPKLLPGQGSASTSAKPELTGKSTPFSNVYSRSGFDMIGILAQVVSRHDPKINLGPVDLSCAFVLSDVTFEDSPIVYVSNAFERLTGYSEKEIVGQNCRFLQSPDAKVEKGESRKFVDSYTAWRLRCAVEQLSELQVSIINYRKGGQPFVNLVTMIPVRWNSKHYYVGFQVDLVEKPDAVTKRNPDGTYMIDYNRSRLPNYIVPSPDTYEDDTDPATQFSPKQVSVMLDSIVRGQPIAKNHLHHLLVENTDDVIFVLSFEGEFLYLSPSSQTVLEYKSSDLVGKTLSTVCHPSDIGRVTRELRARTSGDPVSVIYRIRRKYTGFTWLENHGRWHITERGRQFMVLVGRIIPIYPPSQLANVERGGLAENDLWAKLSLSGIILFMSSKSRAVIGRSSDDLMGKCLQDILVCENSPKEPEIQRALETSRNNQQSTFTHKIRHRKGHIFTAQITLYPGGITEGIPMPNFLIAHLRFPKPVQLQSLSAIDDQSRSHSQAQSQSSGDASLGEARQPQTIESTLYLKLHPSFPHPYTTSSATMASSSPHVSESCPDYASSSLLEELNPTRGSSWHFELRELEKQNRELAEEEAQRLLARSKKRKRKQSIAVLEKSCAMCQTRVTPEWRRGPSGNRDLCNSCRLRWAKQVRSAVQAEKPAAVD
ncbi:hypothetical protein BDW62DRAFT_210048 [Aspergillus aurantiobrunneus]